MTPASALATRVARMFGRRHCVLTGSGSTAIFLALQALKQRAGIGDVLVPALACTSIPQVIEYAGFVPRFVDVRADDFTMDMSAISELIDERTRAILPVHLYGHAADMDAVRTFGVPVIEDAAQSIGGRHDGSLLGSFGDFGILSFGAGKILDAGGGGALLFDDDAFAIVIANELALLPSAPRSPNSSLELSSFGQLNHGVTNYLRVHSDARMEEIWRRISPLFAEQLYLHAFPEQLAKRIDDGLNDLPANLAARLQRAERHQTSLQRLPLTTTERWRASGAVWRYSFLAPSRESANRISAALRLSGVNASNHYWSLADLYEGDKALRAHDIGSRMINFWVDERATDEAIDFACMRLAQLLAEETV